VKILHALLYNKIVYCSGICYPAPMKPTSEFGKQMRQKNWERYGFCCWNTFARLFTAVVGDGVSLVWLCKHGVHVLRPCIMNATLWTDSFSLRNEVEEMLIFWKQITEVMPVLCFYQRLLGNARNYCWHRKLMIRWCFLLFANPRCIASLTRVTLYLK